jgi:hypothetical protein
VRGVWGAHNKQVLKRSFSIYKPNVIILQEIMCKGPKTVEILSCYVENWALCLLASQGRLRGKLIGWNNLMELVNSLFIIVGVSKQN